MIVRKLPVEIRANEGGRPEGQRNNCSLLVVLSGVIINQNFIKAQQRGDAL